MQHDAHSHFKAAYRYLKAIYYELMYVVAPWLLHGGIYSKHRGNVGAFQVGAVRDKKHGDRPKLCGGRNHCLLYSVHLGSTKLCYL